MSVFSNVGKVSGDDSGDKTNVSSSDAKIGNSDISADDIEKLLSSEDDGKDKGGKDTFAGKDKKEDKPKDSKDKKDDKTEDEDKDEIELQEEEELDELEELDKDKKDDEEDEDEEELKTKKEDDVDLEVPPRKKEILAAYPEFFKKFPFFEKMMFRDRWYSENFGSMEDAKGLLERASQFDEIEQKLFTGDISHVLLAVKESDKKAYDKIVDNYVSFLENNDKDAFNDVANNLVSRVIMGMVQRSKSKEDKDLFTAADILHEFFFDKPLKEFQAPKARVTEEKNDEKKEIDAERQSFMKERFEISQNELSSKIDNTLRATIEKYIDPKGNMTPYEKKTALTDALKLLHSTLGGDKNFRNNLDKLWKAAFSSKFKQSDLDKIKSSYLGRAQGELKDVIKKIRAEVLKGREKPSSKDEEDKKDTPRDRKTTPGRPRETNKTDKKEWDKKTQTVEDFLST